MASHKQKRSNPPCGAQQAHGAHQWPECLPRCLAQSDSWDLIKSSACCAPANSVLFITSERESSSWTSVPVAPSVTWQYLACKLACAAMATHTDLLAANESLGLATAWCPTAGNSLLQFSLQLLPDFDELHQAGLHVRYLSCDQLMQLAAQDQQLELIHRAGCQSKACRHLARAPQGEERTYTVPWQFVQGQLAHQVLLDLWWHVKEAALLLLLLCHTCRPEHVLLRTALLL